MGHITREALEKKREEVDSLWRAVNMARIAAAKVEEEYKNMRYEYFIQMNPNYDHLRV